MMDLQEWWNNGMLDLAALYPQYDNYWSDKISKADLWNGRTDQNIK